jgi:Domain of unknown function (DUF6458)
MRIGFSLFLIALGAILRFAVTVTATGFSIHTIGLILIIVGAIGVIPSLLWLTVYSDRDRTVTRDVYVEREVPVSREAPVRTVRER